MTLGIEAGKMIANYRGNFGQCEATLMVDKLIDHLPDEQVIWKLSCLIIDAMESDALKTTWVPVTLTQILGTIAQTKRSRLREQIVGQEMNDLLQCMSKAQCLGCDDFVASMDEVLQLIVDNYAPWLKWEGQPIRQIEEWAEERENIKRGEVFTG